MSTLLSISREMLAELYPRTLYDFAQHLNTYESDFSIEENEKLAQLPPSLETFDEVRPAERPIKLTKFRVAKEPCLG